MVRRGRDHLIGEPSTTVLMDAHAHFRRCFEWDRFFDAAAAGFRRAAAELDLSGETERCLWLAEGRSDRPFRDLAQCAGPGPDHRWGLERTEEEVSLRATGPGGGRIVLIAGRQIETRERLEVLALGTTSPFPRGLSFEDTVVAVTEAGAIPVVPWGFGKWWFRRRRILEEHLESGSLPRFFLGDSAGRPRWLPASRTFEAARAPGIPILPGSDPPPFPTGVARVAERGLAVQARWDPARPAHDLKAAIREIEEHPRAFGHPQETGPFLRDQAALFLRSLLRRLPGQAGEITTR